jgi:general stress protein 26
MLLFNFLPILKRKLYGSNGEASINTDPAKIEELWTPVVNIWSKKEKRPNVSLIKVKPTSAYFGTLMAIK